jgi:Arc/MetJ-type ribon-helix-helix transcriptional regulator
MARTQTMVQLTDELVAVLDEEAVRRGISRSAVIRAALELYLEGAREHAVTNAIVEGYRRIPPATPDAWGELERLGERSTNELLQRLDAEERSEGHAPW